MKLQVALEYMMVFAFVILIFMIVFVTIAKQRASVSNDQIESQLQLVAQDLANQFQVAAQAGSGYTSSSQLPSSGSILPYSLNITKNGQIIVTSKVGTQTISAVSYALSGSILSNSLFTSSTNNNIYSIPISNGTINLQNSYGTICVDYACPNVTSQTATVKVLAQLLHAPYFGGLSSWISVPNSNALSPTSQVTVSAWVFPGSQYATNPSGSSDHDIVSKGLDPGAGLSGSSYALLGGVGTGISAGFFLTIAGALKSASSGALQAGQWYLITGTYNGADVCIYVNATAKQCSAATGTIATTTNGLGIGSDASPGPNRYYNGMISDVQVYGTALSQAQITALYQEGIGGAPTASQNVAGWWPLNGNTNDYSGFGDNGAVSGYVPYGPVAELSATVTNHTGSLLANTLVGFSTTSGQFQNGQSYFDNYTNANGIATAILASQFAAYNGQTVTTQGLVNVVATAFSGNSATQNSLAGWWPISLGLGSSAQDVSGSNAIGSMHTVSWAGPAYSTGFDGYDSYVVANQVSGTSMMSEVKSASLWFNTTGDTGTQVLLSAASCGVTGISYILSASPSNDLPQTPQFEASDGLFFSLWGIYIYVPYNSLADGAWHNAVVSWVGGPNFYVSIDGTTPPGYVTGMGGWVASGQPFTTTAFPGVTAKAPIVIGDGPAGTGCGSLNTEFFNGSIADVQIYSSSLTTNQISLIYKNGVSSPPLTSAGVLGWWPLGGDAVDYSGSNNNGSAINTQLVIRNKLNDSNSSTIPLLAASFNGKANIALSNTVILQPESTLTVSGWVNASAAQSSGSPQIISDSALGGTAGYALSLSSGEPNFLVNQFGYSSGSCEATGTTDLLGAGSQFVTGTYNTSSIDVYVNGVLQAESSCNTGNIATFVDYGPGGNGIIGQSFNGAISNVQFYSSELNQQNILQLYRQGPASFPLQQQGLVGWYLLNGNANDSSTYANSNVVASNVVYISAGATSYPLEFPLAGSYGGVFNGQSSYISLPSSTADTARQTVSAWVYPLGLSGNQLVILYHNSILGLENGKPCVEFGWSGAEPYLCSSTALPLRTWSFVTGTYNGVAGSIYVNGVLSVSNTLASTTTVAGEVGYIGECLACAGSQALDNANTYFNGSIADVQMYGTGLNASQVFQLYHNGVPPSVSTHLSMSWLP